MLSKDLAADSGLPVIGIADENQNSNTVSVLLGDGTGKFGAPTNFRTGVSPNSVAVADFNKDKNLDLAVSNISSSNVSILLGDGKGGFAQALRVA